MCSTWYALDTVPIEHYATCVTYQSIRRWVQQFQPHELATIPPLDKESLQGHNDGRHEGNEGAVLQ